MRCSLELSFDTSVIGSKSRLYLNNKSGRKLEFQNALLAEQKLKITKLEHQIKEIKSKKCVKIGVNKNKLFAKMPDITETQETHHHVHDSSEPPKVSKTQNFKIYIFITALKVIVVT